MKKSLLLTFATCLVALVTFSAFSDSMTAEQKKQQQNIADLLTEKLDAFRIAKEQECQERAIEAAVVKADEMIAEAANQKVTRKPVKKKPTYTAPKGTTTPPPPPPPVTEKEAVNKGKKTDAAKKAVQDAEAAAKKAIEKRSVNKGKKKSGN